MEANPGAVSFAKSLSDGGTPVAVIPFSRSSHLDKLEGLDANVEVVFSETDLADSPTTVKARTKALLEGARRLGLDPSSAAAIGAAPDSVAAGRAGGFALTLGVDPDRALGLRVRGADAVVASLAALPDEIAAWSGLIEPPPHALASLDHLTSRLSGHPAVFLDYDGTLTPIVDDPVQANIDDEARSSLEGLAQIGPVSIVSGRGLDDVRSHVRVDSLNYSGSHGFEIELADGTRIEQEEAAGAIPDLDQAEQLLENGTQALSGVFVERKPYAIAVHTRRASSDNDRRAAASLAEDVAAKFDQLILTGGKEIHELRPAVEWDKGSAIERLLGLLPGDREPIYVGDDDTDEDGFRAARRLGGVGVVVGPKAGAETWADYSLVDPDEVIQFLARLAVRP